ncbi:MAG: hypothetical protein KDK05_12440 [Candidatus Competibacteraceae bacterium]|nr:hypothetical protein [Candidatus Competibacteraceae bacterium]
MRLHIRYSGYQNSAILEANCSKYLEKMSDTQIVSAMTGVNANVPVWQAANLEASAYPRLMRSSYNQITSTLVEEAYGYAHTNAVLGQSVLPVVTDGGTAQVVVPPAFQYNSTAFEYDSAGLLIGYYNVVTNTLLYYPTNGTCAMVEFVEGIGGKVLDEIYDVRPTTISPINNYRWYIKVPNTTTGTNQWQDVTNQPGYYSVDAGVSNWKNDSLLNIISRTVRSDKNFLLYQTVLNPSDGVLIHALNYTQNTMSGQLAAGLQIPLGELDLWLNGHSLILGIDYVVNFPTITIFSKKYLVNAPGPQTLTVRSTGFCKSDLTPTAVNEVGYVWNGLLSADGEYDLHDGKVQRVVVGGALRLPSSVAYVENASTGSDVDGTPYSIRDYVNPLNGLIDIDPYTYYYDNLAVEGAVSDYLTMAVPQQLASPINPITTKYPLYSPFIGKIISALNAGIINDPGLVNQYPDSYVTQLCAPYTHLLAGDPIAAKNLPDLRYCSIDPHWLSTAITMNANNYRFITNVVRIYANNIVDLSTALVINSGL